MTTVVEQKWWQRTFNSLSYRNFRLLWLGSMISQSGDWMDQIALNWLTLEMTNSALALGLVNLARAIPILALAPLGGVLADRLERRRLLQFTQGVAMVLAFVLAFLVSSGLIQLWQVVAITAARGIMMSFNMPARQSLIADLVPRAKLGSALALNSATFNLTRILGPAVGGVLIGIIGVAPLFYLNGFSFLGVLWTLQLMTFPADRQREASSQSIWTNMSDGVSYIKQRKILVYLVFLAVAPMLLAQPYMTMLTVFARDVMQIGPMGLGMLTAAAGLGAVAGSLATAAFGSGIGYGKLMLAGMIAQGLTLIFFANSFWPVALIMVFMVGFAGHVYTTANNTLIQLQVEDQYRGRVVSILFINRGIIPLGVALAGWLTEMWGAPMAMSLMGAVVVVMGSVVVFRNPELSRLDSNLVTNREKGNVSA